MLIAFARLQRLDTAFERQRHQKRPREVAVVPGKVEGEARCCSPDGPNGVLRNQPVGGDERHVFHHRLGDHQPVPRVAVQRRKARATKGVFQGYRERFNTNGRKLARNQKSWIFGKIKLPQAPLGHDFPNPDGAEEHAVASIRDELTRNL
jgi:hypothetical protein